jgi:hypothetical protein
VSGTINVACACPLLQTASVSTSRTPATGRKGSDPILALLSRLKNRAPHWRTVNIGFARNQVLLIDGMRWYINYKIHALCDHPSGPYKPWLRSSITLWPSSRGKRDRQGWRPRLRTEKWYERCDRELAHHGYHGEWIRSPWGRFGDYWRKLDDLDGLCAELHWLDGMELRATESDASFGEHRPRISRRRARASVGRANDDFFDLWSSFADVRPEWRTSSFMLQRFERIEIRHTQWRLHRRIYVHDTPRTNLWFGSFIDLWPSRRSVRTAGGWHPRLLEQRWYRACSSALESLGYVGEWRLWNVRHGEFRKRLQDSKAAMAELARLDRSDFVPR